ncbi:juvenile hormone-binding protein [Helicoverpa armigera]|uniref:Juvenile hormone binding protein 1 n=1 Tax=Helicoverpa armigera TaxID=29058 RepID=A0A168T0D5_HELAM|nr:juvenile hormone-binding protein [Helicoverpa armigera]ANC68519.1 juvenile hormone binding protein 1 [Helicoverpa armigera]
MAVYRSLILLAFAGCVLSEEAIFTACSKNDMKCMCKSTESFMANTFNGLPDYNMKPTDPLIIPELKVVVDEGLGLVFEFKNINITGLKNLQVQDFKLDTDKKLIGLKSKAVLNIVTDNVKIELTKQNKAFNGAYSASTTALGRSDYGYSFTKKDGKEFFLLAPEVHVCEIVEEPNVVLGDDLQKALDSDPDAQALKAEYEANKVALRKKTLCRIIEDAFTVIINNYREVAQQFPKEVFVRDI